MLLLVPNTPFPLPPQTRAPLEDKTRSLNARFRHHSATDVLQYALSLNKIALVSSFGAESAVLLHMAAVIDQSTPVLFIDTQMLFTETLVYQQELTERLGLRNLHIIRAADITARDPQNRLHEHAPNACCALRKTAPLQAALTGYDGWITGRKRFQSGTRATLEFFEVDPQAPCLKINPLAHWTPADVADYIAENRLPRHPMVAQGYPSIGCIPCTTPVTNGEDPRAGRWRDNDKDECGLHLVNGKLTRTKDST
jgi:phosphoadenosine phosphosulfate reductase